MSAQEDTHTSEMVFVNKKPKGPTGLSTTDSDSLSGSIQIEPSAVWVCFDSGVLYFSPVFMGIFLDTTHYVKNILAYRK
jgi:hypothetical protein